MAGQPKKDPVVSEKKKTKRLLHWEKWYKFAFLLTIYDMIAVNAAYFLALWARFDFHLDDIPKASGYLQAWYQMIPLCALVSVVVFYICRLYQSLWRFASFNELLRVTVAVFSNSLLYSVLITLLFRDNLRSGRMPASFYLFGMVIQYGFILGIRFAYRFVLLVYGSVGSGSGDRILLIGAGNAGQMILRDVRAAKETTGNVVCIIDDDPKKWRRSLDGVPIVGGRDEILRSVKKYNVNKIFLAIPGATAEQRRDILNICQETDCEIKNLPGMYQLVNGDVYVSNLRKVSVEDLLGREPIRADMEEVFRFIQGKTVLVTGGGGAIGSELCRQIAKHDPRLLIIFDIYENNAYDIQQELKENYPDLRFETLIGSVRDSRRIFDVFKTYRPDIVYHAAAHKHVPLMEDSPCEAIKNNAVGTYKTAYAAMVNGCQRFVLISTDKAVNPTNIMGASKRLCEMIIQSFDSKIKEGKASEIPQLFTHVGEENADKDGSGHVFEDVHTEFVAVRFGNVLGSNGSVIPIFKKQIEKGGPVTVTHPDIIRYFMTIPEAVSLVLLAGTYAHGGEIFVLDMGSPVKIDTLARNLIRLSGLKPDVDIKVEYTGLRPGEKLYEEKLMAEEGLRKTDNDLIHIGCPIPFAVDPFLLQLEQLMHDAYANRADIVDSVAAVVSTYHPIEKGNAVKDETYFELLEQEEAAAEAAEKEAVTV